MKEKIIAIAKNNKKVYYKTTVLAEEFYDDNGYLAHTQGQIPDGEVVEIMANLETVKHYRSGKLDGILQVVECATGKVTITEEYVDGELKQILDTKQAIKQESETQSKEYLKEGLVFIKDRKEVVYYDNGTEVARCSRVDGALISGAIPDGVFKNYYDNGFIKVEAEFNGGVINGRFVRNDEFGRVLVEETYSAGLPEGPSIMFSYQNGEKTKITAFYKDGRLEGKRIAFYPNGREMFIENYSADKLEGKREAFFEGGIISAEENYKKGLYHGPRIFYYPNGAVWYKEMYVNSQLEGERVSYYPTGELYLKEHYEHGLLEGVRTIYDKSGTAEVQEEYRFGQKVRKRGANA